MPDNTLAGLVREQTKVLRNLNRIMERMNENITVLVGCASDGTQTDEQLDLMGRLKDTLKELDPDSMLVRGSPKTTYKSTHKYIEHLRKAIRRASSYTGLGPEFDGKKEEE
jgi:hypothetical protein